VAAPHLILFDIDGTLLHTQRAGTLSMHSAAKELFGEHFTIDGINIAGRIDPLIWADLARANGIDDFETHHDRFREVYVRHLRQRLAGDPTVLLLPGVETLVTALRDEPGVTVGLLTGNYPESGRLKIEAAGLDMAAFEVCAWGDDGGSRRDLPLVAIDRHAGRTGTRLEPGRVLVIGDTPHDVDCARAHGCRSLAVATGVYSRDELAACDPDRLEDDLSATGEILEWIMRSEPVA